jgi:hypothetical protein
MSKYLTGHQVIATLNIEAFELVAFAKKGMLRPYTRSGKPVRDEQTLRDSEEYRLDTLLLKMGEFNTGIVYTQSGGNISRHRRERRQAELEAEIAKLEGKGIRRMSYQQIKEKLAQHLPCAWESFDLPKDENKSLELIRKFQSFLYLESDVEKLNENGRAEEPLVVLREQDQKVLPQTDSPKKQDSILETKKPSIAIGENYFIRDGDSWKIGFKGKKTRLTHVKGILYIAHLLEQPDTPFYPYELALSLENQGPEFDSIKSNFKQNDENSEEDNDDDWDAAEYDSLKTEQFSDSLHSVRSVDPELTKIELEGIKKLVLNARDSGAEKEYEQAKEYALEYGVFTIENGKTHELSFITKKKLNKENENARSNIRQHLTSVEKKLKEKNIPELSDYIHKHLVTRGNQFMYDQSEKNSLKWYIKKGHC